MLMRCPLRIEVTLRDGIPRSRSRSLNPWPARPPAGSPGRTGCCRSLSTGWSPMVDMGDGDVAQLHAMHALYWGGLMPKWIYAWRLYSWRRFIERSERRPRAIGPRRTAGEYVVKRASATIIAHLPPFRHGVTSSRKSHAGVTFGNAETLTRYLRRAQALEGVAQEHDAPGGDQEAEQPQRDQCRISLQIRPWSWRNCTESGSEQDDASTAIRMVSSGLRAMFCSSVSLPTAAARKAGCRRQRR